MFEQRAGQKVFVLSNIMDVIQPAAAAATWWDNNGAIGCCQGAWQAISAASYAASLVDLTGNGNNLTEGNGAVPWSAGNGWEFLAGSAQWLETGLTPETDQTWSMLLQFNTAATAWTYPAGCLDWGSNMGFLLRIRALGGAGQFANGAAFNGVIAIPAAGANLGIVGANSYVDGNPDAGPGGGWGVAAPPDVWIGCLNRSGGGILFVTANIESVAIYDCVLSDAEVSAVATLMDAL